MIWEKTDKTVHANGEAEITYSPKNTGSALVIESRKKAIAHANRSGSWMHTTFFVVNPEDGTEREYASLKAAKDAAETIIREAGG